MQCRLRLQSASCCPSRRRTAGWIQPWWRPSVCRPCRSQREPRLPRRGPSAPGCDSAQARCCRRRRCGQHSRTGSLQQRTRRGLSRRRVPGVRRRAVARAPEAWFCFKTSLVLNVKANICVACRNSSNVESWFDDFGEEAPRPGFTGIREDLLGAALLHDLASSMKTTVSATSRAKPISCVTMINVVPDVASSRMTSRTSLTSSGSSAEVGSSKSRILGSRASARAMATRCCWPPDNCRG